MNKLWNTFVMSFINLFHNIKIMFDDFDDSEPGGEDFYHHTDIEESLVKFNQLDSEPTLFFSEEEIEALSYHFFLNSQYQEQLKIVNHGLYLYPNKADFLIEKASVLSIENKYLEALECIQKAKDYEPYNALIYKMQGELFCDLDRLTEAEESFKIAIECSEFEDNDFIVEIYINYSQCLIQEKRFKESTDLMAIALKKFPKNELLFNQIAMNFIANNQYNQAIEHFQAIIDNDPYSYLAWYQLGRFYELSGQISLAIKAYEYSSLASKDSKNAFFSLGNIFEEKSKYKEAIEYYSQSIKNSGDVYPYICIARCYLGIENGIMSRSYLRKAKDLEGLLPEYNYLLGYSYLVEKQALKALAFFKKVRRSDKEDFSAIKGIITCYSELERFNEIEVLYQDLKTNHKQTLLEGWKEFASVLYVSEMDQVLEDLLKEIQSIAEYEDELNGVLSVIKFDQEPSNKNKDVIISRLLHKFDDTIESVKLFCHTLYDDDKEFKQMIQIYQKDIDE